MTKEEYIKILDNIPRYTTEKEKNARLYTMDDTFNAIKTAKILGLNPSNEFEAIAFIFKAREQSVSDIIEFTHVCTKCEYQNLSQISIPDMFWKGEVDESVPIGLFTEVDDIDNNFLDSINTLSISEYNKIEDKILINNIKIFDPAIDLICRKCKTKIKTSILYHEIISKFSIRNLYEQYLDISHFSNMTKLDTDSMFPFERDIFLGLIQDKEDEKSKK